jgi:hypothetical protein
MDPSANRGLTQDGMTQACCRIILVVAFATAAVAQDLGPTLSRPTGTEALPAVDGFIQRWLVLEPLPATGLTDSAVQAAVKKEYFPDQFTVVASAGDKVTVGGSQLTWHALETKLYTVNHFHFARALGRRTRVSRRFALRKGLNVIWAAIVNGGAATHFCARLLDTEDRPLLAFTTTLNSARARRALVEQQLHGGDR